MAEIMIMIININAGSTERMIGDVNLQRCFGYPFMVSPTCRKTRLQGQIKFNDKKIQKITALSLRQTVNAKKADEQLNNGRRSDHY